jgi:2'-5' RNA ligase
MRLFIAVDADPVSEELLDVQRSLSGAGLKKVSHFHITLKFLGEVADSYVPEIIGMLDSVSFPSFSFSLSGMGFFPDERRISVVWVGVDAHKEFLALHEKIDSAISSLFRPDNNFVPHVTLARVRFLEDKSSFLDSVSRIAVPDVSVDVSHFHLFRSTLTPSGPVYEIVASFGLK